MEMATRTGMKGGEGGQTLSQAPFMKRFPRAALRAASRILSVKGGRL